MSRKTRRHPSPSRPREPTAGPQLRRIESGAYVTADGKIRVENRNDGKRDALWVAENATTKKVLARGPTLREVRRKLERLVEALNLARALTHGDSTEDP